MLSSAAVLAVLLTTAVSAQDPDSALGGPTNQRGFAADQAFAVGEIDHINRFNGNLILTIPIGPSYPVSSHLSYGLVLSYNARLWDFGVKADADCPESTDLRCPLITDPDVRRRRGVRTSTRRPSPPFPWSGPCGPGVLPSSSP